MNKLIVFQAEDGVGGFCLSLGRGGVYKRQFQLMMNDIVRNAIAENNQSLGQAVSEHVGEKVIKEMNYLIREQEEQEEERYRKLDEAIRSWQMNRKEKKQKEKLSRRKAKAEKAGKHRFRTKESTV